jgi:hypothetical protein
MEYYNEYYELEIVYKDPENGLNRPGMIETKVTGIRALDDVKELRYMFQNMVDKMPESKLKIGRKIMFYCHACDAFIGDRTIPLRVEQSRPSYSRTIAMETEMSINTEMHRCLYCGHHTKYAVQDPIISVY